MHTRPISSSARQELLRVLFRQCMSLTACASRTESTRSRREHGTFHGSLLHDCGAVCVRYDRSQHEGVAKRAAAACDGPEVERKRWACSSG